ncbi:MAG TPA: hypothetical protein VMV29_09785 [Ktedonobacterales bacterium]|nr:hypothetical protein [Ktedonobacterales bacterium]
MAQRVHAAVWTPAHVAALQTALRIEEAAQAATGNGLAKACLAALRTPDERLRAEKAAKLAVLLRRSDATAQAMWRRVSDRARRLEHGMLASEAGA